MPSKVSSDAREVQKRDNAAKLPKLRGWRGVKRRIVTVRRRFAPIVYEPAESCVMLSKISSSLLCMLLLGWVSAVSPQSLGAQQPSARILQGQETDEFPSVGIVGSLRNGGFCTGTLITPTHVLTAAHCAEVIEGPTAGTFDLDGQIYETFRRGHPPRLQQFHFCQ